MQLGARVMFLRMSLRIFTLILFSKVERANNGRCLWWLIGGGISTKNPAVWDAGFEANLPFHVQVYGFRALAAAHNQCKASK